MNILQQIFSDHYEEIKYTLKTRPVVLESIEKMIHCGDPAYGGAMYGCPSCGALKFVPFRCKSRFCPSCGNLYSIQRTTSMSFKIIQCVHRHCVFTIPLLNRLHDQLGDSFKKVKSDIYKNHSDEHHQ